MAVPAEEVWREYSRNLQEVTQTVHDQYDRVRTNPGYWRRTRVGILEKRILSAIDLSEVYADDFYRKELENLMLAGGRTVTPDFTLDDESYELINQIRGQATERINLSNRRLRGVTREWGETVRSMSSSEARSFARGNFIKAGTQPRDIKSKMHYQPGTYVDLNLRIDANRTYNMGVISAARQTGQRYVRISDGADCGLTHHEDPRKADGLVLKIEEAAQYPVAHPSCQRTFVIDEHTKSRKRAGRAAKAIRVGTAAYVGVTATTAAAILAVQHSEQLQRALTNFLIYNSDRFADLRDRIMRTADKYGVEDNAIYQQLFDDEWAAHYGDNVSPMTAEILYGDVSAIGKVVGDDFENVTDLHVARRLRLFDVPTTIFHNSIANDVYRQIVRPQIGNVQLDLPKIFSSFPTLGAGVRNFHVRGSYYKKFLPKEEAKLLGLDLNHRYFQKVFGFGGSWRRDVGKMFRFGASKGVRNSRIIPYMNIKGGQLFRYRFSRVKHGLANRLILNPNGMIRAGFILDPRTGYVIPSLSLIPKGPIRITNVINRSPGKFQDGVINSQRLGRVLGVRAAKGAMGEFQESVRRVINIGTDDTSRRLKVSDFKEGALKGLIHVVERDGDGTILSGYIEKALEIGDELYDLHIRNGAFVTRVPAGVGRITSVTTEARLILPRGPKFSLRINTNLRQFELDRLRDLLHLKWEDIQTIRVLPYSDEINSLADLRHLDMDMLRTIHFGDVRFVSIAMELRALRYTPLEISRVMRIKLKDVKKFLAEGDIIIFNALLDHFKRTQRYIPDRIRADILQFLTTAIDERDLRTVEERIGITPQQAQALWDKAEESWGRKPYHNLIGAEETAFTNKAVDVSTMVLSLTRDEIKDALGLLTLDMADEIREMASAVLMRETVRSNPAMAEHWGRMLYGGHPHLDRFYIMAADDWGDWVENKIVLYQDTIEGAHGPPAPFGSVTKDMSREMITDIASAFAAVQDSIPNALFPRRIIVGHPITEAGDGTLAAYDPVTNDLLLSSDFAYNWKILDWRTANPYIQGWNAGVRHPLSVVVHEVGHSLHMQDVSKYLEISEDVSNTLINIKGPGVPTVRTTPTDEDLFRAIREEHDLFLRVSNEEMRAMMGLTPEQIEESLGELGVPGNVFDVNEYDLPDLKDFSFANDDDVEEWFDTYLRYNPEMHAYISENISGYAATNVYEFMAESLTHATTSLNEEPLSQAIMFILQERWKNGL